MKSVPVFPRKCLPLLAWALLACLSLALAACEGQPTPPTDIPLPTAAVPPLSEIDAALTRWANSQNKNYLVEIEELTQAGARLIRVVVAGGEVRAAQVLVKDAQGKWQAPTALPAADAQAYTVESLLQKLRADAAGEGAAPMNMIIIFDPLAGFPSVVQTLALATYGSDGKVHLNREASYTWSVTIAPLIEDTVGLGQPPVLWLTRSGGPAAWCDSLRVFAGGASIYSDDCRRTLLQIKPPAASMQALAALAARFASLDLAESTAGAARHLLVNGTGQGDPSPEDAAAAWQLAGQLIEQLSKPIGAGTTLLFAFDPAAKTHTLLIPGMGLAPVGISPNLDYLAYTEGGWLKVWPVASGRSILVAQAQGEAALVFGVFGICRGCCASSCPAGGRQCNCRQNWRSITEIPNEPGSVAWIVGRLGIAVKPAYCTLSRLNDCLAAARRAG